MLKKIDLKPYSIPYIKVNSKWIPDLNVKPKIIKLQGENKRKYLCGLELGKA